MRTKGIAAQIVADKIRSLFDKKGFAFFDGAKAFNLNIVGIRSPISDANDFDDRMIVVYRDDALEWVCDAFVITTDPGKKYLNRPINVAGAAILCPGQYRGVYEIAKHRGQYDALCQRGGKVKVWRDNNKDDTLDHDVDVDDGWFGINIHRAHPLRELEKVNGYSAGCQVFSSPSQFRDFMQLAKRSEHIFGNSFTYTLIDLADLVPPAGEIA